MLKSKRAIGAGLIIIVLAISILVFFALPRVNVTGTGTVEAYPDEVQLSFTVRSDDTSAAKAAARNGASMSAVLEALASQGVRKSDVKTVGYWLSPVYDPYNYTMVTGYVAIHSLQVILTGDNITSVGTIIDAHRRCSAGWSESNRRCNIHVHRCDLRQVANASISESSSGR